MSYFRSAGRRTKTRKYNIQDIVALSLRGAPDENTKIQHSRYCRTFAPRGAKAKTRKYDKVNNVSYFRSARRYGENRVIRQSGEIVEFLVFSSGALRKHKNTKKVTTNDMYSKL
jgi:hypothetical protein